MDKAMAKVFYNSNYGVIGCLAHLKRGFYNTYLCYCFQSKVTLEKSGWTPKGNCKLPFGNLETGSFGSPIYIFMNFKNEPVTSIWKRFILLVFFEVTILKLIRK